MSKSKIMRVYFFVQAVIQGLEIMTGIIDGWNTHLMQEGWNIPMINHWLHIKDIRSCVLSFAVTSPQNIGISLTFEVIMYCNVFLVWVFRDFGKFA